MNGWRNLNDMAPQGGASLKSRAIIFPVTFLSEKKPRDTDDGYIIGDCPDALPGWRVLFNLYVRHEIQAVRPRSEAYYRAGFCGPHGRHRGSLAGGWPFSGGQSERGQ